MKKKKNRLFMLIGGVLIVVAVLIVVIFIVGSNNKVSTLKCKSLTNDMTIKLKGNKPEYVSGTINLDGISNIESIKESISMYSEQMILNEKTKTIRYAFSYSELNSSALNFIGLNYDKKVTYNKIKDNLENSNYYCK